MLRRQSPLLLLTASFVIASCARTDPTPSDLPDPNIYAVGICNHYARCTPAIVRTQFGTVEGCTSALAAEATKRFGAPGVTVTRRMLNACILETESAPCDREVESLATCDFRGSLVDGASCASGIQCTTGTCARQDTNAACGTCAPRNDADTMPSNEGEPCSGAQRCNPILACVNGACVVPRALDEACGGASSDPPCDAARGLVCSGGKCVALLAPISSPCTATPFCEASYCSSSTKICVGRRGEGEDCTGGAECAFPLDCRMGVCTLSDPSACR